jgi:DNA repair exonuclease SbcCD ATPase subunit
MSADESQGNSEIDRIMSEIGELQDQMASLSASEGRTGAESPASAPAPVRTTSKPVPQESTDSSELSELFKDIEGGESSLLAETLADLSANSEEETANSEEETANSEEETANSEEETANSEEETANSEEEAANSEEQTTNSEEETTTDVTTETQNQVNVSNESTISKVTPQMKTPQKENSSDNSLSMTVSGQMSLKLNFEVEGQEILVQFNTDMIHIQFSEGTEFKIPLKRGQFKKAA